MKQFTIAILFAVTFSVLDAREHWIDPHNMDFKPKLEMKKASFNKNSDSGYCSTNRETICSSDMHLKRIIRLLLTHAKFDQIHSTGSVLESSINLQLSESQYKFLADFAKGDRTEENVLLEVSSIFETAFKESFHEYILTKQEQLWLMIFNPMSGSLLGFLIVSYITYKLMRAQFTWWAIVKFFAILFYAADCAMTYLQIIQKEEVENLVKLKTVGLVPPECDPKKMSWWEYTKSKFSESDCKTYYEATHDSYRYLITPTRIITHQFRELIVDPLTVLGEALGKFYNSLFWNLPFGINLVLLPFLIVVLGIGFCIFLTFIFGTRVKFGIPYLFNFEFSQDRHRPQITHQPQQERTVRPIIHIYKDGVSIEDVAHDNIRTIQDAGSNAEEADKSKTNKTVSCQAFVADSENRVEDVAHENTIMEASSNQEEQGSGNKDKIKALNKSNEIKSETECSSPSSDKS